MNGMQTQSTNTLRDEIATNLFNLLDSKYYNVYNKHYKYIRGDEMEKEINGKTHDIKPYANLFSANLRDANLRDANLRGANLRGADLRGANLRDADLRGANLRDANLRDANLRDANLRGANLRGADLRDANLFSADLSGANGILILYVPSMSSRGDYLYAVQHSESLMVKAGCFWGTLAEFKDKVMSEKGEDSLYATLAIPALESWQKSLNIES
jgi:hypothetical protein